MPKLPSPFNRVKEQGISSPSGTFWWAEIPLLPFNQPWQLSLCKDILTIANKMILHPYTETMALWAWPVNG